MTFSYSSNSCHAAVFCLLSGVLLSGLPAGAATRSSQTQAWAERSFTGGGRRSSGASILLGAASTMSPFSFVYAGQPSTLLLPSWKRTVQTRQGEDRTLRTITWTDPQTALRVTATVCAFKDFPALDWVLRFTNTGSGDTPILENIQSLDAALSTATALPEQLEGINGDSTDEHSFVPMERPLLPGASLSLMPSDGRPSSGTFPFFDIQQGEAGCFVAIGWTGRWKSTLARAGDGATHVTAGLELTHLRLHPGESIRTPRILLLDWQGDRMDAHNSFRRLLLAHYCPRVDGKLVRPAVGAQMFNQWAGGVRPEWGTTAGQLRAAEINQQIGADTLWMDAGWFEGNFPNGAGNWFPRPKDFPTGLKPVGDAAHARGLRFLVWYEPERVAPGTQIAREHPPFVLGGAGGGLFNLSNPEARQWMTDLLNREITEYGIDCWRSDFNMDPLPYWRANDVPDRQGMTESLYVEGLYAMWDALRAAHPHLYLDDCASGGRRIDLETLSRAVVQTRSDTEGVPGRADWDQSQTYGLSLFVPINASFTWRTTPYDLRSTATAGLLGEWDIFDSAFPKDAIRTAFAEVHDTQEYWYGDYYPLTPWSLAPEGWIAWQLDRPDLKSGIALAFRRQNNPDSSFMVSLHGLKQTGRYQVQFTDDSYHTVEKIFTGAELSHLNLTIDHLRGSLLIRYRAQ